MFINNLRAFLAVVIGLTITALLAFVGCFVAIPFKLCSMLTDSTINPARMMIPLWAYIVEAISLRLLLRMKVEIQGVSLLNCQQIPTICISNHPSTIGTVSFTRFVSKYIGRDIVAVAKIEHLKNPIIGWPLWLLDSGIFVDRSSRDASREAVNRGVMNSSRPSVAVIIHPDATRPTGVKIARDKEKFRGKVPNLLDWQHTTVPRAGALDALVHGLDPHELRVVNATIACNRDDTALDLDWKNIFNAGHLVGSTLKILIENVELPTNGIDELVAWLNAEWDRKNRTIAKWKKD